MADAPLPPPGPPRGSRVPDGRLSRLARMGGMATGVAGGMLRQGALSLARGERPALSDMLLTPANVRRVTGQLAEMRGAAMKMGQLLSMDAGDFVPPELAAILSRLRADAEPMPDAQLGQVLAAEWGADWRSKLTAFDARPIAAASIGQVHRARGTDGRDLAIKVQYPGIARSIDSDVDNVATLLRLSGLLPKGLDIAPLLVEAKRQLHDEADYRREAECLERFAALLESDPVFRVPASIPDLSTGRILAMAFAPGEAIETLGAAPQPERDRVAAALVELVLRELFEFGWMQTDPNFANYRYDAADGRIVLLDFGATRAIAREVAALYRGVLIAARNRDPLAARRAIDAFGIFDDRTSTAYRDDVLALFDTLAGRLLHGGPFDFADPAFVAMLRDRSMTLAADRDQLRTPPAETLFVQRKLGGTFHLAARLKARIDLRQLVDRYV